MSTLPCVHCFLYAFQFELLFLQFLPQYLHTNSAPFTTSLWFSLTCFHYFSFVSYSLLHMQHVYTFITTYSKWCDDFVLLSSWDSAASEDLTTLPTLYSKWCKGLVWISSSSSVNMSCWFGDSLHIILSLYQVYSLIVYIHYPESCYLTFPLLLLPCTFLPCLLKPYLAFQFDFMSGCLLNHLLLIALQLIKHINQFGTSNTYINDSVLAHFTWICLWVQWN